MKLLVQQDKIQICFRMNQPKNFLKILKPDILINAAARVGGIYANNTKRTEFLLENLKINLNVLEASIGIENIKIINLGSSCIYPLNAEDPITEDAYMTGFWNQLILLMQWQNSQLLNLEKV